MANCVFIHARVCEETGEMGGEKSSSEAGASGLWPQPRMESHWSNPPWGLEKPPYTPHELVQFWKSEI